MKVSELIDILKEMPSNIQVRISAECGYVDGGINNVLLERAEILYSTKEDPLNSILEDCVIISTD